MAQQPAANSIEVAALHRELKQRFRDPVEAIHFLETRAPQNENPQHLEAIEDCTSFPTECPHVDQKPLADPGKNVLQVADYDMVSAGVSQCDIVLALPGHGKWQIFPTDDLTFSLPSAPVASDGPRSRRTVLAAGPASETAAITQPRPIEAPRSDGFESPAGRANNLSGSIPALKVLAAIERLRMEVPDSHCA